MEPHEIYNIETRIERVRKSIVEKQKQIEDLNNFISGHSSDAYALQEQIDDLQALINYDQEVLTANTVIEPKDRFSQSLETKPKLKNVTKGTRLEDLF